MRSAVYNGVTSTGKIQLVQFFSGLHQSQSLLLQSSLLRSQIIPEILCSTTQVKLLLANI
jgi:hypothetical protein